MSGLIWFLLGLAAIGVCFYHRVALWMSTGIAGLALLGYTFTGAGGAAWLAFLWVVYAVLAVTLNAAPLRRMLVTDRLYDWFRRIMPGISDTEREALEAGSVWWDGELYTGRPDWDRLLSFPRPRLTEEEQAFLDGPVEELCRMLDDWDVTHKRKDLPPEVWNFIRESRMFGIIVPKEYGGLGFSNYAHSQIVMKISSRCGTAGVTVMVPNSLGPGELLKLYGTDAQKDYYLPRLAEGREIPCFGLTGPYAGSDAGAIPDTGVVCKGEHEGREVLGLRLNFEKRYITLGPVATLIGLAFQARDPDQLLGGDPELGPTLALIPADTPGVEQGHRHYPLEAAFQNGPLRGRDVFIPMEQVIGGQEYIGQGWKMLMNCLAAGRGISLPAQSNAAAKMATLTTGSYARVRKQFGLPVGAFEGVEEALARIGGETYLMDAARRLTLSGLDLGEHPAVISGMMKYHMTEAMRRVINDAMDVHGGKGICQGPNNYLGQVYNELPIAITVEGANILTRSMIIFGQGAIRCHPFLLKEMLAAGDDNADRGKADFDQALMQHAGFVIGNAVRAFWMGLTGARLIAAPTRGVTRQYYRQLTRISAAFCVTSDIALFMLGGDLKRREKLSGRFGDILSCMYLASAVLKRFQDDGRPPEDLALVRWACEELMFRIQERFRQIFRNFPGAVTGMLLHWLVFPWGAHYAPPSDVVGHRVAERVLGKGETRERLVEGIFRSSDPKDAVGRLEDALRKTLAAEPLETKLARGLERKIEPARVPEAVEEGLKAGVIDEDEARTLREAFEAVHGVISVDEFPQQKAAASRRGGGTRRTDSGSATRTRGTRSKSTARSGSRTSRSTRSGSSDSRTRKRGDTEETP